MDLSLSYDLDKLFFTLGLTELQPSWALQAFQTNSTNFANFAISDSHFYGSVAGSRPCATAAALRWIFGGAGCGLGVRIGLHSTTLKLVLPSHASIHSMKLRGAGAK